MDNCEDGMGIAEDLIGASAPGPTLTDAPSTCLLLSFEGLSCNYSCLIVFNLL